MKTAVIGAAVMLFIGIFDMPYGYYTLLRLVVTATFAWAAFDAWERKMDIAPYVLGLVALLFNPFIPVHLDKEIWIGIDIAAGVLILGYYFIHTEATERNRKLNIDNNA